MVASLMEALSLSDDSRVITSAEAPYEIRHTNKAWHKLTGYKFTEVANTPSAFLQGPGTESEHLKKLKEATAEAKHCKVRVLNYTKDGEPFYNTIECFPLKDANGKLTHYCGVLTGEPVPDAPKLEREPPIPKKQSVEETPAADDAAPSPARRSKRMKTRTTLADALNNTNDAVVLTNPTPPYSITHVNQPWCEMCGYTLEEVEGLTNSLLQGPETDMKMVESLMQSVKKGEPASATLVNYKKGNVRFVNQVSIQPVYNEQDELEQFMALLHEVDGAAK